MAVFWFLLSAQCVSGLADQAPEALAPAEASASTLTHAAQILALSAEAAREGPLIQVRAMVTHYQQAVGLFVQDETGGVFVYHTGGQLDLKPGQYVEVSGRANQGRYSPIIDKPRIKLLETGPAIHPRSVSLAEIYLGGLDAQWVQLTGVVRTQKRIGAGLQLELAVPPQRITVWIPNYEEPKLIKLDGCVVTIRGVVGAVTSDFNQLVGFQIFANAITDVAILQASLADAFSASLCLVRDLKQEVLRRDATTRVRTRGTVTLCWPGLDLFIQDSSGGLEIHAKPPFDALAPGDVVEAAGFLGPVLDSPLLEDAVIRKVGTGRPPQPIAVAAGDLFRGRHNHELVELEASFLEWAHSSSNCPAMALLTEGHLVTALLESPGLLSRIEPGCRLRLTGVCRTGQGLPAQEPTVLLLLRSAGDVKVIGTPSATPWARLEVFEIIAALAGTGLVVAFWYAWKQRRQTERMLQLQANLQAEMRQGEQQLRRSLEERDRMGRDLHDDIIQSIYAVGLNLEDCRRVVRQSPQHAEERVGSAINTLNNTLRNVRGFLAGLEPRVLNGHELKTALKSLALTSGEGSTPFQIEVDASASNSLTSAQATQLLHIAKEAMSNSLRHAQALTAVVSLRAVSTGICLEVRDNGVGFDPEAIAGTGHGLRNISSRAREMGAQLEIRSARGQGCRILVTVRQQSP